MMHKRTNRGNFKIGIIRLVAASMLRGIPNLTRMNRIVSGDMDSECRESSSEEPVTKKCKTENESRTDAEDRAEAKPGVLSKRQLKRLKKREKWLAKLPEKRARERYKMKLKRKEAREKNLKCGPTRKELKTSKMCNSSCKVSLVLDFSFDDYMTPKDIAKCINQLGRCYSINRRCENPAQFYVVNFGGLSQKEISKHKGYENWDVYIRSESYLDLFDKGSLIYLTSESENVIKTVEQDKVYIIGALVDHNSQKGLCHSIAVKQGINHGCLPIEEYLEMKTRKVLAVNHVFEIMIYVSNGMPWKEAFLKTLPHRKGAVEKQS